MMILLKYFLFLRAGLALSLGNKYQASQVQLYYIWHCYGVQKLFFEEEMKTVYILVHHFLFSTWNEVTKITEVHSCCPITFSTFNLIKIRISLMITSHSQIGTKTSMLLKIINRMK